MEQEVKPNDRARWEDEIANYEQLIASIKSKIALNKALIKAWDKYHGKEITKLVVN